MKKHHRDDDPDKPSKTITTAAAAMDETNSSHSASSTINTNHNNGNTKNKPSLPTSLVPCPQDWPYIWAIRDGTYLDWKRYCQHDPALMATTVSQQLQLPARITGRLYLGNAKCVMDVPRLQQLGIRTVLNMAGTSTSTSTSAATSNPTKHLIPNGLLNRWTDSSPAVSNKTIAALQRAGITYYSIAAEDKCHYPLLQNHWEEVSDILAQSKVDRGGKILVICRQGINRSVLVVAAYYMTTTHTNVLETMRYIRQQRGNGALSNEGFQEQLVAFARWKGLLGDRPGQATCIVPIAAPPQQTS